MNKIKLISVLSFCLLAGILIEGCVKDKGKAPAPATTTGSTTGTPGATGCDTVTYTKHIKPIIDANCVSCHGDVSPTGGFPLTSYAQLKDKAQSGKIEARVINGTPSFMPPTGPLPQAQRDLINCWLKNGHKQ